MTPAATLPCQLLASNIDVSAIRTFMARQRWRVFRHPALLALGPRFLVDQLNTEHMASADVQLWLRLCLSAVGRHVGNPVSMSLSANRLKPGQEIARHRDPDHGEDTRRWPLRHHLVIDAEPGCTFTIGAQTIEHRMGQLWRVDHTRELFHWAKNNSLHDRTVITFNVSAYEASIRELRA